MLFFSLILINFFLLISANEDEKEILKANKNVGEKRSLPIISIICVTNCMPANPDKEIIFEARCEGYCGSDPLDYVWTLAPDGKSTTREKYIVIASGAYPDYSKVNVTVAAGGGVATYVMKVLRDSELAITCQENCQNYHAAFETMFSANCEKRCDEIDNDAPYVWQLIPPPENEQVFETGGTIQEKLTIPSFAYTAGQMVNVTTSRGNSRKMISYMVHGDCDIQPRAGDIYTDFILACNYKPNTLLHVKYRDPKTGENGTAFSGPYGGPTALHFVEGRPLEVVVTVGGTRHDFEFKLRIEYSSNTTRIREIIMGSRPDSIPTLMDNYDYKAAMEAAIDIAFEMFNVTDTEFAAHFHRHLLHHVMQMTMKNSTDAVISFMKKSTDVSLKFPDPICLHLSAEITAKLSYIINDTLKEVNRSEMETLGDALVMFCSNILEAMQKIYIPPIQGKDIDYPSYGYMAPERIDPIINLKHTFIHMIDALQVVGRYEDAEGNLLEFVGIKNIRSLSVVLPFREEHKLQYIDGGNRTYVYFSQELAERLSFYGLVKVHLLSFKLNPLAWDVDSAAVNTEIIILNVWDMGGQNITNLRENIDLMMERTPWAPDNITGNLSYPYTWVVYKLNVHPNSLLAVNFSYTGDEYYTLVSSYFPKLEEIRNGQVVTEAGMHNTWSVPQAYDIAYVGIARKLGTDLKYSFLLGEMTCGRWEREKWEWSTDDCALGMNSTDGQMHCLCTHLSLIAGSFYVPESVIVMQKEWELSIDLERSRLMVVMVCILLLGFVVLMVLAARRDEVLERGRAVHILPDTVPGDEQPYLVAITTGLWQGATTTANVVIQLLGTEAHSRIHIINSIGQSEGSQDWFLMFTPVPLGVIAGVRLYHDSYGYHPHWYCETVEIRDLVGRRKYVFRCKQWLSLIWGDGRVDRIIYKRIGRNLSKGENRLGEAILSQIRDDHIYLSMFMRPKDSTHTSKERVAVLAATFSLSCLVCALLYGIHIPNQLDFEGTLTFTGREVAIILVSALVAVPYSVLLSVMFRRSRPLFGKD